MTSSAKGFVRLRQGIHALLDSKRIGQPVFVRCTLQRLDKDEDGGHPLAHLAIIVRAWIGQPIDRLYAVQTKDRGQLTVTLLFREGATAQLTYARSKPVGDGLDAMILGNRGAAYYDFGSSNQWDEPTEVGGGLDDELKVVIAIEKSLQSGKPEPVAPEDKK